MLITYKALITYILLLLLIIRLNISSFIKLVQILPILYHIEVKNYIAEIYERKSSWEVNKAFIAELYNTKVGKDLAANDEDIMF